VNFDAPGGGASAGRGAGPAEPHQLLNRFVDVIITEAMPNSLRGRLVADSPA
jgi:hypothetical protein